MGGIFSTENDKPKGVVLVPPLFERDFRGRSRMCKSSYDWLFCKPGLKWLFNDYIRADEAYSILRFRMALRFQPDADEPLTFIDLKSSAAGRGGAVARACFFDAERGLGTFAVLPLVAKQHGETPDVSMGVRYSSPEASVGLIGRPASQSVSQIWAVGRRGPVSAGVQFNPGASPKNGGSPHDLSQLLEAAHNCASYSISYTPDSTVAGRGNFTTALELKERSQLTISLLYHMAVQRLCKNPLEDDSVVGITNYIDIGLQVATNLVASGVGATQEVAVGQSHLRLGAAWQVNKNWVVKGRLGSDAAAFAVALKAWWQPSMTLGLATVYDFHRRLPRFGVTYTLENYGNIRYERSGERRRMGKALVQRHVALPEDLANREGKGLLVELKDLDNRALLGQTQPSSAQYL